MFEASAGVLNDGTCDGECCRFPRESPFEELTKSSLALGYEACEEGYNALCYRSLPEVS